MFINSQKLVLSQWPCSQLKRTEVTCIAWYHPLESVCLQSQLHASGWRLTPLSYVATISNYSLSHIIITWAIKHVSSAQYPNFTYGLRHIHTFLDLENSKSIAGAIVSSILAWLCQFMLIWSCLLQYPLTSELKIALHASSKPPTMSRSLLAPLHWQSIMKPPYIITPASYASTRSLPSSYAHLLAEPCLRITLASSGVWSPDHEFGTLSHMTSNWLPLSPHSDPNSKLTSLLQLINNWPPSELSAPLIRRHTPFCARCKCLALHFCSETHLTVLYWLCTTILCCQFVGVWWILW